MREARAKVWCGFLIAGLWLLADPAAVGRSFSNLDIRLVSVATGDRIVVDIDRRRACVDLARVRAPRQGEYGYEPARQALERILAGKKLSYYFRRLERARDHDECIAGQIVFDDPGSPSTNDLDSRNVNILMVRSGWARFSETGEPEPIDERLKAAEIQALRERVGLWAREVQPKSDGAAP